jgi:hypothetical protein
MAQRRPTGLGRDNAASLKHIGGRFESQTAVPNRDHTVGGDVRLQRGPTNRSDDSPYFPDVTKPANNGSEWITVDRQPTAVQRHSSGYTTHHGGHTTSSNIDSNHGVTPMPRWHSETAKVEPWNGLGQVLRKSNTTAEVSQAGKGGKTSSMETRKDSTSSRASFGNRNGYT